MTFHPYPQFLLILALCIIGASSDSFYFTVSPTDQDVEEGQPLRLRCAVTPAKDIYYSWLQNSTHIEIERENGRRFLETDSNLQILHADRDLDQGAYQCQAFNKSSTFTTASKVAKVNVYWMDPEVSIRLLKPAKYEDISMGKEVVLGCDIKAYPPMTPGRINWYHNGISRLPNVEILRDGSLRIAEFGTQHVGTYHCRGMHAAGKVESRPPFTIFLDDSKPPKPVTRFANDQFLKYILPGHSVELTCPQLTESDQSDDLPADLPSITIWSGLSHLGDSFKHLSQLHGVTSKQSGSSIAIKNFDSQHATFYKCESSRIGTHAKDVFLFQVEMATLYPAKRSDFTPRLNKNQPYVVQVGQDAQLRYYVDRTPSLSFHADQLSNPTPHIEWRKRGERNPIPAWWPDEHQNHLEIIRGPIEDVDDHGEPRRYVLRGQHLIIHQTAESDSGTYDFVLENAAGRSELSFQLLVTSPPEFYHQPNPMIEHVFDEGTGIRLQCGVKRRSIPGSIIYWEKDGQLLQQYSINMMALEKEGELLRFPKLKPEDQGKYQCFVQTDGYSKRSEGREQMLVVRSHLQFVHLAPEQFLEVDVQGRIPCRARGYGSVKVDWFRKVGPNEGDLEPIQPPNQVEAGTLIIQLVQKHDEGQYVCIARSDYRNRRINATVNVVVGKKAQILHISSNQTVLVGSRFMLTCRASGDPLPQVSWIVKKKSGFATPQLYNPIDGGHLVDIDQSTNHLLPHFVSGEAGDGHSPMLHDDRGSPDLHHQLEGSPFRLGSPSSTGLRHSSTLIVDSSADNSRRIVAYSNGSLIVNHARLSDSAEYICLAGNKRGLKLRQGPFVKVMTAAEFERHKLGGGDGDLLHTSGRTGDDDGTGSRMFKTVLIVVGCSFTYLAFIIGVTVFCSMHMVKKRRNRARKANHKSRDNNDQLLGPLNNSNATDHNDTQLPNSGTNQPSLTPAYLNTVTPNTTIMTPLDDLNSTGYSHLHQHPSQRNHLSNHHKHGMTPMLSNNNGISSDYPDIDALFQNQQLSNGQQWWPRHSEMDAFGNRNNMSLDDEQSLPADDSATTTDSANYFQQSPHHHHHHVGNGGIPTSDYRHPLTSAPPPTPLDSRSHFSGLSSGNSTSLYSRSVLSGASNAPSTTPNNNNLAAPLNGKGKLGDGLGGGSPPRGPPNSLRSINQFDRMSYPRSELAVEGFLGKGEFGDVFTARARLSQDGSETSPPHTLALVKSLVASTNSSGIDEFNRQLDLFNKIEHANFTRLIGACMEHEPLYMLLEYSELGTLKQFLRRLRDQASQSRSNASTNTLLTSQRVGLCRQIAQGMDFMARQFPGTFHRDLAARNVILVSRRDEIDVKISNLALVYGADASEYYRVPESNLVVPLRWLAPELITDLFRCINQRRHRNNTHQYIQSYTTQSDVWAFGVLMWECFTPTNNLPLASLSDHELLKTGQQASVSSTVPPISTLLHEIPSGIPGNLTELLSRCWSPLAQQRPSFADITQDLQSL